MTLRLWNVSNREPGNSGELFTLALTGVVGSIAVDQNRWVIFTTLRDGRVLSWAIEPEATEAQLEPGGDGQYDRGFSARVEVCDREN